MMKINDDFEMKRDNYQWILTHWKDGIKPKTKEPTRTPRITYHATIEQVASVIVERTAGECGSLQEIVELMAGVKSFLVQKIEVAGQ